MYSKKHFQGDAIPGDIPTPAMGNNSVATQADLGTKNLEASPTTPTDLQETGVSVATEEETTNEKTTEEEPGDETGTEEVGEQSITPTPTALQNTGGWNTTVLLLIFLLLVTLAVMAWFFFWENPKPEPQPKAVDWVDVVCQTVMGFGLLGLSILLE